MTVKAIFPQVTNGHQASGTSSEELGVCSREGFLYLAQLVFTLLEGILLESEDCAKQIRTFTKDHLP